MRGTRGDRIAGLFMTAAAGAALWWAAGWVAMTLGRMIGL